MAQYFKREIAELRAKASYITGHIEYKKLCLQPWEIELFIKPHSNGGTEQYWPFDLPKICWVSQNVMNSIITVKEFNCVKGSFLHQNESLLRTLGTLKN